MPKGIPVATFAIGEAGAVNAALFAVAILALTDRAVCARSSTRIRRAADARACRAMKLPMNRDPSRRHARRARRRPARPHVHARRAQHGLSRHRARSRPRVARRRESPTAHRRPRYDDRERCEQLARPGAPWSRPNSRTCPAASAALARGDRTGAARRATRRRRAGPHPREGVPRRARLRRGAVRGDRDARRPRRARSTKLGCPAILKRARFGYDGKGQARVGDRATTRARRSRAGSASRACSRSCVPLEREVSRRRSRAARRRDAQSSRSPRTVTADGILDMSDRARRA